MKKTYLMIMSIFFLLSVGNITLYAEDVSNYIIMGNIPPYERLTQTINPFTEELKTMPGYWIYRNSGALMGSDHFLSDHIDVTYKTEYQSETIHLGMEVQVTQHAGGDSDRWLLHEVEDSYRDLDDEDGQLGMLLQATRLREISGNKIIGRRGNGYTWVSNNVVVDISYADLRGNKPEPLEVVQAYLAKFPSKITMTPTDFKGNAHNVQWIKDEMERRLWLCDKWNAQFQAGKTTQKDLLYNLNRSLSVFLNYRHKYYGVSTEDELAGELAGIRAYMNKNDVTSMLNKLTEYKTWWAKHKEKRISLP